MFLSVHRPEYIFSTHRLFQEANIRFCLQYRIRSCSCKHLPPRCRVAFIRFVGLPPERGGDQALRKVCQGKVSRLNPKRMVNIGSLFEKEGYWSVFTPTKDLTFSSRKLEDHSNSNRRIGFARTTIFISSGMMDFVQDNWKKRGNRPVDYT